MLSDITQLKVQEVADSSNCWFGSIFRAGVSQVQRTIELVLIEFARYTEMVYRGKNWVSESVTKIKEYVMDPLLL
jgi:hypothetical protein